MLIWCWREPGLLVRRRSGHQRFLETLIKQLLALAAFLSALFALASPFFVFVYVFAPLVERLVRTAVYRWARQIDRIHLELTAPLVRALLL